MELVKQFYNDDKGKIDRHVTFYLNMNCQISITEVMKNKAKASYVNILFCFKSFK